MRPTIYGYLRVWPDTSDRDAARIQRDLTECEAIARTQTRDIVVPDLSHFCPLHGLESAMQAILEHVAGARVWAIAP